jgi:hypothetical protein
VLALPETVEYTAKEGHMSLAELLDQRIALFVDRVPDWDAFSDARVDGYRRAQHRFIGG